MSRFNTTAVNPRKTVNSEGAVAYTITPELELYTAVCTSSMNPKAYSSVTKQVTRLRELLAQVDPDFAWKLAVYAREQMYLRTIPVVIAVELTKMGHGNRAMVTRIIQRADEITEMLAYYALVNGGKLKPLANSLKRGIADAFHKFDAYQFAKYS